MRWPNPSSAYSRRKSSEGWGCGGTSTTLSSRPSSGSGGSTTIPSRGPSDMFPQWEYEEAYYQSREGPAESVGLKENCLR